MAADLLQKANTLFVDEDFNSALDAYNQAIQLDETNSDAFVRRSLTHTKLGNFTDALEDANKAISLDSKNGKGYLRKGIACFELEEYETALSAFEKALSLDPDNPTLKTWIRKCNAELGVDESPLPPVVNHSPSPAPPVSSAPSVPSPSPISTPAPAPAPASAPTPASKIRHEWYQNNSHVFVTVFAKGVKKEDATVDIQPDSLSVAIAFGGGYDYVLDLDLCEAVEPGESKVEHLSTKIEIKLKKAKQLKWETLERAEGAKITTRAWDSVSGTANTKKDWDKIVKDTVEEEKLDGEAGLNKLFQDIYSGGSEEQRRAMIKSFTESGGTVLSTNWEDVKKDKVAVSPPQGMEARKWGED